MRMTYPPRGGVMPGGDARARNLRAAVTDRSLRRPDSRCRQVADSAYIAPTAVLCGDVTVGPHSRVLFGAVVTAEGGPVEIGAHCVVMENAIVRGVPQHPPNSATTSSSARMRH
jgi:serine acetyltransferase